MVRYTFSEPGRVGPPEAPRVPEHDTTPGPGGTDSRPWSAARYVPVRGRTLEHLSETIEDAPDRVPEDDQDGDQPKNTAQDSTDQNAEALSETPSEAPAETKSKTTRSRRTRGSTASKPPQRRRPRKTES